MHFVNPRGLVKHPQGCYEYLESCIVYIHDFFLVGCAETVNSHVRPVHLFL